MIQIFSVVGSLAKTFLENKAKESQAKQELKIRSIESTDSWEQLQAQASQTSWKDEWFVIVLSIPMICAFIPDLVPYIERGFEVLDSMPTYYKAFLGAAISASFGLKGLATWRK
tara:strand:+ start:3258 stop:3599 length:342 start_codon:yes stop_codon:yes gene_type:complete